MATNAEIRDIRQLQRAAAQSGETLSFRDAREQLKSPQDDPMAMLARMEQENAALKARLDKLEGRMDGFRITGTNVSGEGDRGIMINDPSDSADGGSIIIKDEGAVLTLSAISIDIVGPTVEATNIDGNVTLTVTPLSVKEEDDASPVVASCTTLQFIGKRTIAEEGATANTAKVTIGTIEVKEDASVRAEALKTLTFAGNGVSVSSEAAPVGDDETGDGAVTVTIPGGIQGIAVKEAGTSVVASATALNFAFVTAPAGFEGSICDVTDETGGQAKVTFDAILLTLPGVCIDGVARTVKFWIKEVVS
jgi:hypothetical protein